MDINFELVLKAFRTGVKFSNKVRLSLIDCKQGGQRVKYPTDAPTEKTIMM